MLASRFTKTALATILGVSFFAAAAPAQGDTLCDPSAQNCRIRVTSLIRNEKVGIDVGFWFMEDTRYANELIARWQAGVPVRVIMDTRANSAHAGNSTVIAMLKDAGIPLRRRTGTGVFHWKMMLFAGQGIVEFGSANYSPEAFVPVTAYTNYVAETVFDTDDPSIVNSFRTKFDDAWVNTSTYANYANVTSLARSYPTYPIDSRMNFPPGQSYVNRAVTAYNNESTRIDAIMFRLTDARHADAIINARARGVPVRLIVENDEYRNLSHIWDAYNVDRLYAAGVSLRWRGHAGSNHSKLVLLHGQNMSIFGSSNWTTSSTSSQIEHNMFTTSSWMFNFFSDQFDRMWYNSTGATETTAFVPLPPSAPKNPSPAAGAAVSGSTATLRWYGGAWAHKYDIYFGTSSSPPRIAADVNLGPSESSTDYQAYTTPTLAPATTYYWRIVSKTMANKTASGPTWYFTTSGTPSGGALPSGWSNRDIGSVGVAGSSTYSSGTFNVSGSGADVWGTADGFQYAYQTLSGDGQIVARVASVEYVHAWSKAGVMIRASTASNSAYGFMVVTPGKGSSFQFRRSTGATAEQVAGPVVTAPYYVRIVRSGSTLTGYVSSSGSTWTKVGSASVSLGSSVLIGLGVTSHNNAELCTARFDHVAR